MVRVCPSAAELAPRACPVQERRRIAAILRQPPNRPLHAEERAILWRFRFSLQQEKRALTKFLQCVDWGDASEGRQVRDAPAGAGARAQREGGPR